MKLAIVLSALISALAIATPALASTTIDHTWNGVGEFSTHIVADDDSDTTFNTGGSIISGELHFIDYNDNPYNYGVDTNDFKVKSHTQNGYIEYYFKKTDNYEPMYGPAGQESYTYIGASGEGDFAWHTKSNYAHIRNCNYGWQNNGQMFASGEHIIYHSFFVNDHEGAIMQIYADGTSTVTDMNEDHWKSSYKFGKGCGCYTNAKVDIDGQGTFDLDAYADNEISTDTGISVYGPNAHLNIHADFDSGFSYDNFALEGE